MAKINVLSAQVFNRIAAGEVIDRPYSIVKELVENSIDAGATEIEIYVENGGKQLVRVVDNGSGIERDDLHSAFLPHATSKISKAEDLDYIHTLGFRGEAVASIAAVSKMTITSKVEGAKCYSLTSYCGELGSITESTGGNGTDVCVERLFSNAPVRLKFLKSDKAEEAEITTFVSRFILNRADIAFTYYVNGKKVLQSFGGGEEEALVCVYGAATRAQCIEINAEKHGMRIRGYIGNQNFTKPNKSYQSVFLNGRYIVNATVAAAMQGAYSSYLMKRQYPFYVLHIDMPTEVVDVNVSPNKTDVRFADNNVVYGCIYSVISSVLDGKAGALEYIAQDNTSSKNTETTPSQQLGFIDEVTKPVQPVVFEEMPSLSQRIIGEEKPPLAQERKNNNSVFGFDTLTYEEAQREIEISAPTFKNKSTDALIPLDEIPDFDPTKVRMQSERNLPKSNHKKGNPEKLLKLFPNARYSSGLVLEFEDTTSTTDNFAENKRYLEELERRRVQEQVDMLGCTYVGKIFNTYLVYEQGDNVFLIDQHAAHERLLYDKLRERIQKREVIRQNMLLPFELKVNAFEAEFLRDRLQQFDEIGFEMAEKDNYRFLVNSVPVDIPKIDLTSFFNTVLEDISGFNAIKLEDILKDKLASMACKAAIKGGDDITADEIAQLFHQLQGNMGLKCPHGRPAVVKLSKTEIEKMFKRIV